MGYKISILLPRMQMVKCVRDTEYRFSKVMLVREHWYSLKLTPYAVDDEYSGYKVIAMKYSDNPDMQFREVDPKNIWGTVFLGRIKFYFTEEK